MDYELVKELMQNGNSNIKRAIHHLHGLHLFEVFNPSLKADRDAVSARWRKILLSVEGQGPYGGEFITPPQPPLSSLSETELRSVVAAYSHRVSKERAMWDFIKEKAAESQNNEVLTGSWKRVRDVDELNESSVFYPFLSLQLSALFFPL
jgi:hypothetical protein